MPKPFDISMLERVIESLFETYPELKEDEDLRIDTLHGCTNFVEIIDSLLLRLQDADALANSCDNVMREIKKRRERFDRRSDFSRDLIHRLMEIAEIRKLELATGTVSVTNKAPSVVIVDEALLPSDFIRIKSEPNKTAIKEAILAGTEVAGATMSNGGTTLTIRR
jgi:hypothetical protein